MNPKGQEKKSVKLDWQPYKIGGTETIHAEITSRGWAIVCPYNCSTYPLSPVLASIYIGRIRVAYEYWKSVAQGKEWVETELPNVARQIAEDADNLLSVLGMKGSGE